MIVIMPLILMQVQVKCYRNYLWSEHPFLQRSFHSRGFIYSGTCFERPPFWTRPKCRKMGWSAFGRGFSGVNVLSLRVKERSSLALSILTNSARGTSVRTLIPLWHSFWFVMLRFCTQILENGSPKEFQMVVLDRSQWL